MLKTERSELVAERIARDISLGHESNARAELGSILPRTTGIAVDEAPETIGTARQSPGHPLDPSIRRFFEPRFGCDFSGVRVHADRASGAAAHELKARAYTIGRDVFFGDGEYHPEHRAGQRLIAHELAHTVQQVNSAGFSEPIIQCQDANTPTVSAQADANAPAQSDTRTRPNGRGGNATVYPTDKGAWTPPSPPGGIQILPVVESELPHTDFTPQVADHVYGGIYKVVPQLVDRSAPRLMFYIAFNTKAQRSEFAISPGELDTFFDRNFLFMVAAGNFFGFTGHPADYEVTSQQVGYLALKGDLRGAFRALGRSWLQALQNPGWWAIALGATAGLEAPEAAAGEIEGESGGAAARAKPGGADVPAAGAADTVPQGSAGAMKRYQYEPSPKHGVEARSTARGVSNPAPTNGQAALDSSVQVKPTSPRRVGIDYDTGDFVVLDETHPGSGTFHGHVRSWEELHPDMQRALQKAGMVNRRGKVLTGGAQ